MKTEREKEFVSVINEAISIPSSPLRSEDGREFLISKWSPVVQQGKVVSISIECVVKLPTGKIAASP